MHYRTRIVAGDLSREGRVSYRTRRPSISGREEVEAERTRGDCNYTTVREEVIVCKRDGFFWRVFLEEENDIEGELFCSLCLISFFGFLFANRFFSRDCPYYVFLFTVITVYVYIVMNTYYTKKESSLLCRTQDEE